jgi:hypothetical protein
MRLLGWIVGLLAALIPYGVAWLAGWLLEGVRR